MPLNLAGLVDDSIVDGPGIRFTVFAQGCSFGCPGCHNPQTHAFGAGQDWAVEDLVARIRKNPLVRGVTFSGGDPFFQAAEFAALALALKGLGYELAGYTGFTWEAIMASGTEDQRALLAALDVLVDGPFVQARRQAGLRFRGSDNQRIIDVAASLANPGRAPVLHAAARWAG